MKPPPARALSRRTPASRRRGVTLFLAMTALALFGLTLAVLGRQLVAEARRTQQTLQQAQHRQILLAAHTLARAQLNAAAAGTPAPETMPAPLLLPQCLRDTRLTLRWISPAPEPAARLELVQELPGHRRIKLQETARFAPSPHGWTLQTLAPPAEPARQADKPGPGKEVRDGDLPS